MWHLRISGLVCALVGYTGSFAIVLAGLQAVGASPAQAASGLLVLSVAQGVGSVVFARRWKIPITFAWSTGGAAMLLTTGAVPGGWSAAVGAFVVCGALFVLAALWRPLARAVERIPASIAQAMLAGILLPICLAPLAGAGQAPVVVLGLLAGWLITYRWRPLAATPVAFGLAMVTIIVQQVRQPTAIDPWALLPTISLTLPTFEPAAMLALALPLFVVTMASQNIPGVAIMASYGYRLPWRPSMLWAGVTSMIGAVAGGHAVNLAALSAALVASPEVDRDPGRRWIAAVWTGIGHLIFAAIAAALAIVIHLASPIIVQTVAALALMATLAASMQAATAKVVDRVPVVLTMIVAASGISLLGIGGAFWGLLVGLIAHRLLRVPAVAQKIPE